MGSTATTDTSDQLRVTPADTAIGAEVRGVDVRTADERTLLRLRDALLRHSVLVVRDQQLEPTDHLTFMDRLHPLRSDEELYARFPLLPKVCLPGHPAISVLSNLVENGEPVGIKDAGVLWHTDTCFFTDPDLFVGLYALQIPYRDGQALGATRFTSTTAAFDALPAAEQERLDGMRVVQSATASLLRMRDKGLLHRPHDIEENRRQTPDVVHDLIGTHPITGRRFLYANESFSLAIEGLGEHDSEALLDELTAHVTRPEFGFTHQWQEGDLLLWDNLATQHLATFDYGDIPRRMHRVSTGSVAEVGELRGSD